jgi:hypothetical protein
MKITKRQLRRIIKEAHTDMQVPGLEILKGKNFNVVLGSNLLQAVEGVLSYHDMDPIQDWGTGVDIIDRGETLTAKLSKDGVLTIDVEGY